MQTKSWYGNLVSEYKKIIENIEINNTVRDKVAHINIYRLYYVLMVAMLGNIIHIFIFLLKESIYIEIEMKWRLGVILFHIGVLVIMGIMLFVSYLLRKKENTNLKVYVLSNSAIIITLFMSAVVTAIDQLVTSNVSPFLVICTVVGVVFLMRPFFAAVLYTCVFVLYYNALEFTQFNEETLMANRVNGLTIAVIGFFLSIIIWQNYLMNMKQRNHIEMQNSNMKEKNEQLSNLNIVKDVLFTVITHDIREPLATMVNMMELIEQEVDSLNKDTLEIIEEVKLQVYSSYSMIDGLLDWCKSQKEGFNYNPCTCNLYTIVEETIFLVRGKADIKKINILNKIKMDLTVFVDREMFGLVIRNILNNALKFTHLGGHITVKAYYEAQKIIIAIKDDGIGMDSEKVNFIFKENNMDTTLGTEGEKGMGLGLKLCKEFSQLNGGDIWVNSTNGKGSVFFISVPFTNLS